MTVAVGESGLDVVQGPLHGRLPILSEQADEVVPRRLHGEAVTSGLLHEQADGAALAHAVERHPVRLEEHLTPDRRRQICVGHVLAMSWDGDYVTGARHRSHGLF